MTAITKTGTAITETGIGKTEIGKTGIAATAKTMTVTTGGGTPTRTIKKTGMTTLSQIRVHGCRFPA
jgi:hypothetical protein